MSVRPSVRAALAASILLLAACNVEKRAMPTVTERPFGKLPDGTDARLFTLDNGRGMRATVTNYGADGITSNCLGMLYGRTGDKPADAPEFDDLYAAAEMALAGDAPTTVSAVAQRYGIPEGALAKAFQQLVRAGLAAGTRGIGGGYRLTRPASKVTVLDVIRVDPTQRRPSGRSVRAMKQVCASGYAPSSTSLPVTTIT